MLELKKCYCYFLKRSQGKNNTKNNTKITQKIRQWDAPERFCTSFVIFIYNNKKDGGGTKNRLSLT